MSIASSSLAEGIALWPAGDSMGIHFGMAMKPVLLLVCAIFFLGMGG
jgi:hypothetical protein